MSYTITHFDYDGEFNTVIFHISISIYTNHFNILITESTTDAIVYCTYLDEMNPNTYKLYNDGHNDIKFLIDDCDINKYGITFINYGELYENYQEVRESGIIDIEYDVRLCNHL
jgi:hypothetical protein